jgi:hypothetical protein
VTVMSRSFQAAACTILPASPKCRYDILLQPRLERFGFVWSPGSKRQYVDVDCLRSQQVLHKQSVCCGCSCYAVGPHTCLFMTRLTRLAAAWGNGQFGRLGHGSQSSELFPRVIPHLAASSVSAGGAHTAVVTGINNRFGATAAHYDTQTYCQPGSRVLTTCCCPGSLRNR